MYFRARYYPILAGFLHLSIIMYFIVSHLLLLSFFADALRFSHNRYFVQVNTEMLVTNRGLSQLNVCFVGRNLHFQLISRLPYRNASRQKHLTRMFASIAKDIVTIGEEVVHTEEVKKSKFIAHVSRADDMDQAFAYLEKIKALHPKASHNCWAFRQGAASPDLATDPSFKRFSDDGEPGGTAGRPMLAAIVSENVSNCMIVVSRYFGGTKLGTGGLVRAYGLAAREALHRTTKVTVLSQSRVKILAPIDFIGIVYQTLQLMESQHNTKIERVSETYFNPEERGDESIERPKDVLEIDCSEIYVQLDVCCPTYIVDAVRLKVKNACRDKVQIDIL